MDIGKAKVKSVAKAIMLLNLLAKEKQSMSLQEISRETGWPKSTVHALLSTMMDFSMVNQDASTGKYHLGIQLFELGNLVLDDWNILEVARPLMRSIMLKTGESVNLSVLEGNEVLIIEHINSGSPLRVMIERGTRLPIHASAMGKSILAALPFTQVKRIIKETPLQAFTPHTIVDQDELFRELERIQTDGYAVENGEMRIGMRGVASAVYDCRGKVVYSIGITGMFRRIYDEGFIDARDLVVKAAAQISDELGYIQPSDYGTRP